MKLESNEPADKAANKKIYMAGMATIGLPYTDYYSANNRARNSKW